MQSRRPPQPNRSIGGGLGIVLRPKIDFRQLSHSQRPSVGWLLAECPPRRPPAHFRRFSWAAPAQCTMAPAPANSPARQQLRLLRTSSSSAQHHRAPPQPPQPHSRAAAVTTGARAAEDPPAPEASAAALRDLRRQLRGAEHGAELAALEASHDREAAAAEAEAAARHAELRWARREQELEARADARVQSAVRAAAESVRREMSAAAAQAAAEAGERLDAAHAQVLLPAFLRCVQPHPASSLLWLAELLVRACVALRCGVGWWQASARVHVGLVGAARRLVAVRAQASAERLAIQSECERRLRAADAARAEAEGRAARVEAARGGEGQAPERVEGELHAARKLLLLQRAELQEAAQAARCVRRFHAACAAAVSDRF
jgi:hypothetical protein